jgi:hypothetical protein
MTEAFPHLHKTIKNHKTQIISREAETVESKISGMM